MLEGSLKTTLNYHILYGFPIPPPGRESPLRQRVVELSGRLAAVDDRYANWADAVGVDYSPIDEDTKQEKIYELDAVVAHLYGLTREHVEVISVPHKASSLIPVEALFFPAAHPDVSVIKLYLVHSVTAQSVIARTITAECTHESTLFKTGPWLRGRLFRELKFQYDLGRFQKIAPLTQRTSG